MRSLAWRDLRPLALGLGLAALVGVACSTGGGGTRNAASAGSDNTSFGGNNGLGGGANNGLGGGANNGLGGGANNGLGGSSVTIEPPPPPPDGGRPMRCDASGHCSCINVASYGKPAHYGNGNDNTDAFQTWLNSKSSAKVDLITTHMPITAEFLKNYDVFILQALEDAEGGPFWTFSNDEVKALTDWVEAGGGIISLMGYGNDAREVEPSNQLLKFAGISYDKDDILATCPNNLCYCWGNTIPITGFAAGHPISANLTQIGGFHGRSINAGDATVLASNGTAKVAVAKTFGQGKVFAFADEWVTYTSQWLGSGQQQTINVNDPCYDPSHGYMMTADKVFQVPQFWYNAIKWSAPATQCDFTIDNPTIVK